MATEPSLGDLHIDGPAEEGKVRKDTESCIDAFIAQFGIEIAIPKLKLLALALGDLAIRINKKLLDEIKKKAKINLNLSFKSLKSYIKVPNISLPDISGIAKSIRDSLSFCTSEDAKNLNEAVQNASTIKDPSAIEEFKNKRIAQTQARIAENISKLVATLALINAFKKMIDEKVAKHGG
jgi:hypothetical protein